MFRGSNKVYRLVYSPQNEHKYEFIYDNAFTLGVQHVEDVLKI